MQLSDPAPNTMLYFDAKYLKPILDRGGEICGAIFSKKVPLLTNIGHCPNFLD